MTVDFLKVPLGLKKSVLKEVAVGPPKRPQPVALERYKARRSDAMDTESQYSGYSYKSGHSRSSRKHRWVCVGRDAGGGGGGGGVEACTGVVDWGWLLRNPGPPLDLLCLFPWPPAAGTVGTDTALRAETGAVGTSR